MTVNPSDDRRRSTVIGDLRLPAPGQPDRAVSPVGDTADDLVEVLFELNVAFPGGLTLVTAGFFQLWTTQLSSTSSTPQVAGRTLPTRVSDKLYQGVLTRNELRELVSADRADVSRPRVIFKAWPDYVLYPQIDRSSSTVKADAAVRSF